MQEKSLLGAIRRAQQLQTHRDLFLWLQQDLREYLPHEILVAAWGDFPANRISLDVVSSLPDVRTTESTCAMLKPVMHRLFEAWCEREQVSFAIPLIEFGSCVMSGPVADLLRDMSGLVCHGIKDERGQLISLYAAIGSGTSSRAGAIEAMEFLLPSIDAAFRQIALLPIQRDEVPDSSVFSTTSMNEMQVPRAERTAADVNLSGREHEIMQWVSVGKTNIEIGKILAISPRTVRNHLQSVFRKLDVMNRAQAVFELEQLRAGD